MNSNQSHNHNETFDYPVGGMQEPTLLLQDVVMANNLGGFKGVLHGYIDYKIMSGFINDNCALP